MQSFHEEEEDAFFDSCSNLGTPINSASPDNSICEERESEFTSIDSEFWRKDLISASERRKRFLLGMGFVEFVPSRLSCSPERRQDTCDQSPENIASERIMESSGAVLDCLSSSDDDVGQKDLVCCISDLDSGKKFIVHDLDQDGLFSMLKEVGSNKLISFAEFESLLGLSRSVQKFMRREATSSEEKHNGCLEEKKKKSRSWWRRLVSRRHLVGLCRSDVSIKDSRAMRSKVLRHKKRCVEFTALYVGQEIRAHNGLIRTMKFSPCGYYMASGGEDCIVRIWQVREVEASCQCSLADGSCKYIDRVKEKKLMLGRKGMSAAPIVIPKKVFKLDETPLQEFCGHTSEVLDLSWSNSDCLLTSSMDKTVRMWKIGCDQCLRIFQHNDYVTCVQFNPVDNEYFISGSIDGKVRVWSVSENHVVDWADVRDIVTAICYRPDGKGFVVGSNTGNCRIYAYSGNSMHLDTQFFVEGKKKSAGKPITGLQFLPEDSQRVMITSADSRFRIFDSGDVIHKFRGLRRTKSQLSASFTSDGRHIVSVGQDSKVYIWNCDLVDSPSFKRARSVKSIRSCELFSSEGVSVAVPWPGMDHKESCLSNISLHLPPQPLKILEPSTWLWDSDFCSLGAWLFADGISRGSATWPEEKLPTSPQHPSPADHRDQRYHTHYHNDRLTSLSATWSLVIVTGSHDGTIRSFHNYGLPVRL